MSRRRKLLRGNKTTSLLATKYSKITIMNQTRLRMLKTIKLYQSMRMISMIKHVVYANTIKRRMKRFHLS